MSNSSLVNYKALTKHFGYPTGKTGRGGKKIDKIFVHHMAGILTVEQCGNVFKTREASAHYGIDGKGRVGQYVLEENAAWHCANKEYNQRSIGIELANDGGAKTNWHVSDKAIAKCIDLIVDICKRNGIKKINYTGNLNGNLCMHCWTASTSCPGGYLKTKFKYIAEQVNKKLNSSAPAPVEDTLYKVRKTWADSKSQVGAYKLLANAKKAADKKGLNVYDSSGKLVYESKKKDDLYRVRKTWADSKSQKGAFASLDNAKKTCDEYPGYSVFDESGKVVYTSEESVVEKILEACEAQAIWSKNSKYKWQANPTVEKSKDYETCVTFAACVGQRVDLIPSQKYIWHDKTGKVVGATSNFEIIYPKNKKLKDLKDSLKAGDFVMDGDKTDLEKGSHIFIVTGEWKDGYPIVWDNHSAQGKGGKSYKYTRNRPVIAIARPKAK